MGLSPHFYVADYMAYPPSQHSYVVSGQSCKVHVCGDYNDSHCGP